MRAPLGAPLDECPAASRRLGPLGNLGAAAACSTASKRPSVYLSVSQAACRLRCCHSLWAVAEQGTGCWVCGALGHVLGLAVQQQRQQQQGRRLCCQGPVQGAGWLCASAVVVAGCWWQSIRQGLPSCACTPWGVAKAVHQQAHQFALKKHLTALPFGAKDHVCAALLLGGICRCPAGKHCGCLFVGAGDCDPLAAYLAASLALEREKKLMSLTTAQTNATLCLARFVVHSFLV